MRALEPDRLGLVHGRRQRGRRIERVVALAALGLDILLGRDLVTVRRAKASIAARCASRPLPAFSCLSVELDT